MDNGLQARGNSTGTIDLDAYLDRIGMKAASGATLHTLKALHRAHAAAIPFENLDPFLGRPVALDIDALFAKLVHGRRGGYCYEQNLLFKAVLEALGFTVGGLAARVLWGRPEGAMTPRTHMLLRVEIDGRTCLADVGFGGLTQTAPLRLEPGFVQETPHEAFRIMEVEGYYVIEADVAGAWKALYRFDLSDHADLDYAIPSYYLSTHPASHFVTGLMAARALPDRRLALSGNRLSIHHNEGPTSRREIAHGGELAEVLTDLFGIAIPDRAAFEETVSSKGILASRSDEGNPAPAPAFAR